MQYRKTISLTSKDDQFLATQVQSGEYGNASEVVRAGLRLLEVHQLKLRELRAAIDHGDADTATGRVVVAGKAGDLAADVIARGKVRATKRQTGKAKRA
jgi:antitoxin ParD1/3/4